MTLKTRQRLYIATIIFFIVIAPIIIALAVGLRFDFNTRTIIRTGGAYIKTLPSGVIATLETQLSAKSPHKFMYLRPSSYTISLSKERHFPVTTEVTVYPETITRIDLLELFPLIPSQSQELNAVQQIVISPYDDFSFITQRVDDELHLVMHSEDGYSDGVIIERLIDRIEWNPNENEALLFEEKNLYYADLTNKTISGPVHLIDDASFTTNRGTIVVSTLDKNYSITIQGGVVSPQSTMTTPYSLRHQQGTVLVNRTSTLDQILLTDSFGKSEIIRNVSRVTGFTPLDANHIFIATTETDFIFDFSAKTLLSLGTHINSWHLYDRLFYYSNGFEAWELNLTTLEQKFINRFGGPLDSFSVSPQGSALLIPMDTQMIVWYLKTQNPTEARIPLIGEGKIIAIQRNSASTYTVFSKTDVDSLSIQTFTL